MRNTVIARLFNESNICWVFLLGTFLVVCALAGPGCSRRPEDPAWFQSSQTGKMLPIEELKAEIDRTDSLFDLFKMKRQFVLFREGEPRLILEALDRRRDRILAERTPLGSPCPEADLVAFDYRYIGPGRCRADYLFRVNRAFPANLEIALHGSVDPEHRDLISEARREDGKESEVWVLRPEPPTSAWGEGEVRLLSHAFSAQAIPYNLMMLFYDPARSPGQYGEPVYLGWRQGKTESALLEAIESADNLIDFYRLKGDAGDLPAARQAFDRKFAQLREASPPLGEISEGLELAAFDYRMVEENRYRVDFLFCLDRTLEFDCLISLYGVVDEAHRELLSERRRQEGKTSEEWTFRPFPPTKAWPEGECTLVSHEIEARPIPYNMRFIIYDRENRRQLGELLPLGWRADPGRPEGE